MFIYPRQENMSDLRLFIARRKEEDRLFKELGHLSRNFLTARTSPSLCRIRLTSDRKEPTFIEIAVLANRVKLSRREREDY